MNTYDKKNLPNWLIAILIILLFPVGVYFLVLKTEYNLKGIKKTCIVMKQCCLLSLFVVLSYLFINFGDYLSLFDSHMSNDMYSYKFLYFYIYGILIIISTLVGWIHLNKKCNNLAIYTEFINVKHIKDIKIICDETGENEEKVENTIRKLIEKKYLLNIKIEDDSIVSTTTVDKITKENYIRCNGCGNYMLKSKKNTHCDFCYKRLK